MNFLWRKKKPSDLELNPFDLIGNQWALLTAGKQDRWNAMTVSWGEMGVLWNLPVVTVYVRPERYTFEFLREFKAFTLSFLSEKSILKQMGSLSGRNFDKMKESGLSAFETPTGSIAFKESKLWIDCSNIYEQDLDPRFFSDDRIRSFYREGGVHRMIIGEIKGIYVKNQETEEQ